MNVQRAFFVGLFATALAPACAMALPPPHLQEYCACTCGANGGGVAVLITPLGGVNAATCSASNGKSCSTDGGATYYKLSCDGHTTFVNTTSGRVTSAPTKRGPSQASNPHHAPINPVPIPPRAAQ